MTILKKLNRKIIALIALLAVILLSVKEPIPDFSQILNREINLNKARNYICIAESLPQEAQMYFWGNPAEIPNQPKATSMYYRTQFFYAPRLIHLIETQAQVLDAGMNAWFITTANLDEEQIKHLSEEFQLNLIKNCTDLLLFHKTSRLD